MFINSLEFIDSLEFINSLEFWLIWICSQKQSDEFRLYVYKQLDIQELLELDGVCFVLLLFEVKGMQGYPTLHVINIDVLTDVS